MIERRRLSSHLTLIYRTIIGLVLIRLLYVTLLGHQEVTLGWVIFVIGWTLVWAFVTYRWKTVYLVGETLEVSTFFVKDKVPVSHVRWVEGSSFWRNSPATVTLSIDPETRFGRYIVFIPNLGWVTPSGNKQFVQNLIEELGLEKPHG